MINDTYLSDYLKQIVNTPDAVNFWNFF